jgi:hypothetical protein
MARRSRPIAAQGGSLWGDLTNPLESRLIDGEIFTLSNRHDFYDHLLRNDAVDDSHALLGRIELVIAREVETALFPRCSPRRERLNRIRS